MTSFWLLSQAIRGKSLLVPRLYPVTGTRSSDFTPPDALEFNWFSVTTMGEPGAAYQRRGGSHWNHGRLDVDIRIAVELVGVPVTLPCNVDIVRSRRWIVGQGRIGAFIFVGRLFRPDHDRR